MDQIEQGQQTEAEALASAMAGYNARGTTPPAEVTEELTTEQPAVEAQAEARPAIEAPADPIAKMKADLDTFKAEVKQMQSSSDPDAVRRLHGEIGNINRTIQQMQAAPKGVVPASEINDLAAAIAEVEASAEDFGELQGPNLKAFKVMQKELADLRSRSAPAAGDIDSRVEEKVIQIRKRDAMEALTDDHPDWQQFRETPEFKAWLSGKTPEFQQRYVATWNPAVISKGMTEAKEFIALRQKKQERLERAVAPQGVATAGKPSVLPDEQGALIGYNKSKRLRI